MAIQISPLSLDALPEDFDHVDSPLRSRSVSSISDSSSDVEHLANVIPSPTDETERTTSLSAEQAHIADSASTGMPDEVVWMGCDEAYDSGGSPQARLGSSVEAAIVERGLQLYPIYIDRSVSEQPRCLEPLASVHATPESSASLESEHPSSTGGTPLPQRATTKSPVSTDTVSPVSSNDTTSAVYGDQDSSLLYAGATVERLVKKNGELRSSLRTAYADVYRLLDQCTRKEHIAMRFHQEAVKYRQIAEQNVMELRAFHAAAAQAHRGTPPTDSPDSSEDWEKIRKNYGESFIDGMWFAVGENHPALQKAELSLREGHSQRVLAATSPLINDRKHSNETRLYASILHSVALRSAGCKDRADTDLTSLWKYVRRWGSSEVEEALWAQLGLCKLMQDQPTDAHRCFKRAHRCSELFSESERYHQLIIENQILASGLRDRLPEGHPLRSLHSAFSEFLQLATARTVSHEQDNEHMAVISL